MRHQKRSRRFDRTSSHLKAMMRNMASDLFRHERIVTTPQKAKECRRFAERLVTLAKKGGLANFRRALALLDDKEMVRKLFTEIGPRYAGRQGGYTRILHLADVRLGDNARQCIFELVEDEVPTRTRRPKPKAPKAAPASKEEPADEAPAEKPVEEASAEDEAPGTDASDSGDEEQAESGKD